MKTYISTFLAACTLKGTLHLHGIGAQGSQAITQNLKNPTICYYSSVNYLKKHFKSLRQLANELQSTLTLINMKSRYMEHALKILKIAFVKTDIIF